MAWEWIIVAALLLVAVVPLGRGLRSAWGWLALAGIVAFTAAGAWAWQARLERRQHSQAILQAKTPRQGRPGGYVGSDSCRACHPEQYDSWHRSFHRTMTQCASAETVRGDFNHVTLHAGGQTYHLSREGDEFWVEMPDPDWEYVQALQRQARLEGRAPAPPPLGPNPPRSRKRIGLLTGSHHMQTYWVWSRHGNMQFNFPFTYLFEDKKWAPRNDVFLRDPASGLLPQVWNVNCVACHATAAQPRQDPRTAVIDTRLAEAGISCEACHGPAETHVRANVDPARRYAQRRAEEPDPTITNPARLGQVKTSEACGQCHAIRSKPRYDQWLAEGFPFRPGEEIETCAPLVFYDPAEWDVPGKERKRWLMEGSFWPDGMVRVSGREFNGLAASPCYQRGQLSCLSCHSMHRYANNDDQLAVKMESNQACVQCHSTYDAKLEEHTRHPAGSSGSLCYNCHMPHTTYGLLKAIRSHHIDSPSVQASLRTGRPNACNLCHLDRSLGWTARKISEWYGQPSPAVTTEQESISAAVTWLLSGDAGQRALLAWHAGWEPAQQTAGRNWLAPYVAQLLEDPYSVVRYIAHRSLTRLPGFADFAYDYIGPKADRTAARERALALWRGQRRPGDARPEVLLEANGALQEQKFGALLKRRDDRSMELLE